MTSTAKKLLAAAIVFVLALSLWDSVLGNNMHINIDGDEFDGPLGALFGLVLVMVVPRCCRLFGCRLAWLNCTGQALRQPPDCDKT